MNNKGADQPARPCRLISAFVVCSLDSIISIDVILKVSRLQLVSVAEEAGLSLTWSLTPKTGFLMIRLIASWMHPVFQHPLFFHFFFHLGLPISTV